MSPRRLMNGLGGSCRSLSLLGAAMATLLLLSACSTSSASTSSTQAATSSSTSAVPTTATTPPAETTTTTSTIVTSPTITTGEEALDTWSAFWDAWATVRGSDDLDPEPLESVASRDVVDGVIALFERQRSTGGGVVQTDFVLHPKVTQSEADRVTLEDCVLLVPSFTETTGVWYQAELVRADTGWVVDTLRIVTTSGCVPAEVAAEAIAGYSAYYEALPEFWDPPDPEHPLISEVLADPRLSNVVALLAEHAERGVAFRSDPTIHPEVIEVRSPTELVILDCYEPDPADGLYDLATGERLSDEPAPREGQRNLRSAVMVLEDGKWKSSDFQGQVDFACEFAPTERGLPSV